MQVLMLSWEYPPHIVGGLGHHVAALVPALARRDVHVHVVTPRWAGGMPEERVNGATVHRVDPPLGGMGNFFADAQGTNLNLGEFAQELIADSPHGYDIIHAHDWLVAFAACSLKRLLKIPLVTTVHATERGRGRGLLCDGIQQAINGTEWWLTYESWRVICTSLFMGREVMNYFGVPADKVDVIANGVDTTPFDRLRREDLGQFRSRYAAPDERIVFFVGRLVREKGAHLLIEAVPRVLERFPETKFVIAGKGGMWDDLHRRARELGVYDRVYFTGFIPDEDRDRLLKLADCAVFPSLYEPFGIVALEGMAARAPVVVADVGGLGEVVDHNVTGIKVYPDNTESLAWGILHTLMRPDWARARADNAYRIVSERYSWDHIAEDTIEVYQEVCEGRRRADW